MSSIPRIYSGGPEGYQVEHKCTADCEVHCGCCGEAYCLDDPFCHAEIEFEVDGYYCKWCLMKPQD